MHTFIGQSQRARFSVEAANIQRNQMLVLLELDVLLRSTFSQVCATMSILRWLRYLVSVCLIR
jgi:hypothetical protein